MQEITSKRVAIIGGSDSIDNRISSRDYIVRINDHIERQDKIKKYGCDMLFIRPKHETFIPTLKYAREIHLNFDLVLMLAHGRHTKQLFEFSRYYSDFAHIIKHGGNRILEPSDTENLWVESFFNEWNFVPLTGMLAIEYFRRMNPLEIFVTGMDLYGGKTKHICAHDLTKQALYLNHINTHDPRITLDSRLSESIKSLLTTQ